MYRDKFHKDVIVKQHGFLISIDAEEGTSIELIEERLGNACTWVEGCGKTDVQYMGVIPEEEE